MTNENSCFVNYNGLHISQTPKCLEYLNIIVKTFDIIIEIGYYRGGLTQWFADHKKENAKVIAYDISDNERLNQKFNFHKDIQFIIADCFSKKSIENISNSIKFGGKVLLFCDGGNKEKEFKIFSEYLKSNDVIMVHDYFDDSLNEKYASYVNWNLPFECKHSDIKSSIQNNQLNPYYYEEFRQSLIGSFVK